MALELVANVWPVVDEGTGLVLRYFIRAYAMEAPDEVISETLLALAPTDFRLARMYAIPEHFIVVSEYGRLQGCITIGDFYLRQEAILTPAFAELEQEFARLQGIGISLEDSGLMREGVMPKFPAEPYLVVTSLLETAQGQLIPQVRG